MIRTLALAALLALCAYTRQEPTPPPAAPAPAPAANTQSPTSPQTGALPAPATAAQNETQQATASQESVDTEGERPARSDTSLEQIAAGRELPAPATRPAHQRRARQGGSDGGVLARLSALLRARTVHQELAQNQARGCRVRARPGGLGAGTTDGR